MGWEWDTDQVLTHGLIHITAAGYSWHGHAGYGLSQGWHTTHGQEGQRTGSRTDIIGWEYLPALPAHSRPSFLFVRTAQSL